MEHSACRHLAFSALLDRPVDEVVRLLVRDGASAFGSKGGTTDRHNRVQVELNVPLGGGETIVSRVAFVELGQPEWDASWARLPLTVAAADGERWFPSFTGHLETSAAPWGETEIRLEGSYILPFGAIGRMSGRLGGDGLARASLAALFWTTVAGVRSMLRETSRSFRPAFPEALERD